MTCKKLVKELAGDEWTLGDMSGLSTEDFYTWSKMDTTGMTDILTLLIIIASTFRGSYGSSWGSSCGGSIKVSTRTT